MSWMPGLSGREVGLGVRGGTAGSSNSQVLSSCGRWWGLGAGRWGLDAGFLPPFASKLLPASV